MDIRKSDRPTLKSYFVKNAVPTESNFAELIEAMVNQKEDGIAKLPGEPLSIQADGTDASQKKAINFYKNFADVKPAWSLSLNPRADPNTPATARPGWSIGDADGNSRLFIDQSTGNVGIGTVDPGASRLRVNGPALVSGHYLHVVAENAGRLRVGAAWAMPGLYSGDDGPRPLVLGVDAGQKVYLGAGNSDAYVEGGSGNAYFKGSVGVGTTTPAEALDVNGRAKAGGMTMGPWPANPGGYMFVGANTLNQSAAENYALLQEAIGAGAGRTYLNSPVDIRLRIGNGDRVTVANNGNVGIGTTAPADRLHVEGNIRVNNSITSPGRLHISGEELLYLLNRSGVIVSAAWGGNGNLTVEGQVTIGGNLGTHGFSPVPRTAGWGGGIHTFDLEAEGSVWSRAGYAQGNRDVAENYESDTSLEAADVVSLDPSTDRIVLSDKPNDVLLVGVISSKPALLLNVDHDTPNDKAFPVALCGRVPCKVVDENGAIRKGDLLTSSSIPGHAMRAAPIDIGGEKFYRPGTIIGKAFEPMASGRGVIEVVVFSS